MKLYKRHHGTNQYKYQSTLLDARMGTWKAAYWITVFGIFSLGVCMFIKAVWDNNESYRNFSLPISPLALVRDIAYAETPKIASQAVSLPIKDTLMIASIKMFTTDEALDIRYLVNGESGFNPMAINKNSGACGLFQALPCKKMPCGLSRNSIDVDCQINWGLHYIKNRYQTPRLAWAFWQAQSPHWY